MRDHSKPSGSIIRVALAFMALGPLFSAQTAPGNASPADELKRMVRKLDRKVCRTIVSDKCQALSTSRKSPAKTTRKSAAVAKPKIATTAVAVAPDPIVKPDATAAIAPESKADLILPTLKPKTLAKAKKPLAVSVRVSSVAPDADTARPKKAPEVAVAMLPRPIAPAFLPVAPVPHAMPDDVVVGEACMTALGKIGANFGQLAMPVSAGACSVTDAVVLKSLRVGENLIAFTDQPTLTCGFALRFANWVKYQGDPIVQTGLNAHIKSMGTGPGYECRGRNGDSSAKLSEHAFGNAVDIERIKLIGGQIIEVKDAINSASPHQPVLAGLRSAGCQYFMTVLGPGANTAHASHFHFDLQRRGKKGNHKMCE